MERKVKPKKIRVRHPNGRVYTIDAVSTESIPFVPKKPVYTTDAMSTEPVLFVPKKPAVKVPSEELECTRLVDYLRSRGLRFTHIPNSTNNKKQGVKNKRMGTSPGVPDYLILLPKGGCLWIEMKRRAGGRVSEEQKEWIAALSKMPFTLAYVCNGFDEAKALIERRTS